MPTKVGWPSTGLEPCMRAGVGHIQGPGEMGRHTGASAGSASQHPRRPCTQVHKPRNSAPPHLCLRQPLPSQARVGLKLDAVPPAEGLQLPVLLQQVCRRGGAWQRRAGRGMAGAGGEAGFGAAMAASGSGCCAPYG